jgi:hypothetical protein
MIMVRFPGFRKKPVREIYFTSSDHGGALTYFLAIADCPFPLTGFAIHPTLVRQTLPKHVYGDSTS